MQKKTDRETRGRPRKPAVDLDTLAGRIAANTIRLRESYNLTVAECAAETEIPVASWYRLERGKHPQTAVNLLESVAFYFQVDVNELTQMPKE